MSSIVILPSGEWKPHYQARYTREQLETFARQPHPFIDTRCVLERFRSVGVEVEMTADNPLNVGMKVLIKPEGFFVVASSTPETLINYIKCEATIWTISVPLTKRFAHVYKGMQDKVTRKYRVWCH